MARKTKTNVFEAYIITNLANSKRYVGITTNGAQKRWRSHVKDRNTKGAMLGRAIQKYGKESFKIEVVACARSWADLQEIERRLIAQEGTFFQSGRGYNMTLGGDGAFGVVVTPEGRLKRSLSKMGNRYGAGVKRSPEHIAAIVAAHKGKTISEEHRAILRKVAAARQYSPETRQKLRVAILGVKRGCSPAMRVQADRLKEYNLGRPVSAERRLAMSLSHKANPRIRAHLARVRLMRFGEPRQLTLDFGTAP